MPVDNKSTRILLVDDDERNLRILELILEDEFELLKASTGEEALECLAAFKPDIILLDIMMPGISGIDVCKQVKSSPEYKNIKIILLSGMALAEDRISGYEAGADDYLTKPFDDAELLAKVRVYAKLKFAEEINDLKTNFLSLITHETSTPLNTIIGYASLLSNEEQDSEKQEWLLDIKTSAMNLHSKIENILLLSRLMSTTKVEKYNVPLAELFALAIESLDFDDEIRSRINIVMDEHEVVYCDQILFQRLLTALLDNSIRHTGSESCTTCTCSHYPDKSIEITISDEGKGIDDARLSALFDPFNVPDILSHGEGLSISLAICQQIVRLHGGEISASNNNDHGLAIAIKIPYEEG